MRRFGNAGGDRLQPHGRRRLAGDRAVERMINEAFRETMVDVEARMETHVRGADEEGSQRHENRTTGTWSMGHSSTPAAWATRN
jgi:hypothetical protein